MFVFCVWFGRIIAYEESVLPVSTRPVALEPLDCPSPGLRVGCPSGQGSRLGAGGGLLNTRIQLEAKPRTEADGAQHSQRVCVAGTCTERVCKHSEWLAR